MTLAVERIDRVTEEARSLIHELDAELSAAYKPEQRTRSASSACSNPA
jgi:hypothetical protein